MSEDKIKVNIIYAPHRGPPSRQYENEYGKIIMSNKHNPGMFNIGMSLYSLKKPKHPTDSLYIIEPRCVVEQDYKADIAKAFKYIFTWSAKSFEHKIGPGKIIETNHPSCYGMPPVDKIEQRWVPWSERKDEVVFIANNKHSTHYSELYTTRLKLADMLHHSGINVSWYGQIPLIRKKYFKGTVNSKEEILSKAKFSVCMENSYDPTFSHNYFTEKLPHVWFNGAVPLYMGCYNIDDFKFHQDSYIDLRKYIDKKQKNLTIDKNGIINAIKNYTEEDFNKMKTSVLDNMRQPDGLYHIISQRRVWDKMIKVYYDLKHSK